MPELRLSVDVDAPVEATWAAATDWARQDEWMLATRVRPLTGSGQAAGDRVEARTGLGPAAVVDLMEITRWQPPSRCDVRHLGRVVRGTGVFAVEERDGGSRFVWSEQLDLPLGRLGELAWRLGRPVFAAAVGLSLRRFARWVPSRR